MTWYFFRYWSITVMRVLILSALCHFLYKVSIPHFAVISSLLVVQEVFTWMNIRFHQKKSDKFVDQLNKLNERLEIENLSQENWN